MLLLISVTQVAKHAERILWGRVYNGSTQPGLCGISAVTRNKSKCNNTWLNAIPLTFRTISSYQYEHFHYTYSVVDFCTQLARARHEKGCFTWGTAIRKTGKTVACKDFITKFVYFVYPIV